MGLCFGGILSVLVLLSVSTSIVLGQDDCNQEQIELATLCLNEQDAAITQRDPVTLCQDAATVSASITGCSQALFGCTGLEYENIDVIKQQVEDKLYAKCSQLPNTPAPPPTETPLECDNWDKFNQELTECLTLYDTLDELKFNLRLTRYGICSTVQAKMDCVYDIPGLKNCDLMLEATNREVIDQIKFAHLFDCDVTVNGKLIKPPENDCKFWDWLACHDPLLEAAGLGTVSQSTNLDDIRDFDMGTLYTGIIEDGSKCGSFNTLQWSQIHRCRNGQADKCQLLTEPRLDVLWYSVLNLMYDVNADIVQTITFLMDIETTCSEDCENLADKLRAIETCNGDMETIVESILTKYNGNVDATQECRELDTIRKCVADAVGSCPFAEKTAVQKLHTFNQRKLSMDICQLDLTLTATPGCFSQRSKEERIRNLCSGQMYVERRNKILNSSLDEGGFCFQLQYMANCYAQHIPTCPALERKYWSAERDLIYAANQMLNCGITYQTFSSVNIQPITGDCDYKRWVGCLSELWTALEIPINENKLNVNGFQKLLRVVWENSDKTDKCSKLNRLSFRAMKSCVADLDMECEFPTLTVSDGVPYSRVLRNPLDLTDIENYIKRSCSPECSDKRLADKWSSCLNQRGDSSIFDTYLQDIIFDNYMGLQDERKCKTVDAITKCLENTLGTCDLYDPERAYIDKPASNEVTKICDQSEAKPTDPTVAAASTLGVSRAVYLSVAFYILYAGM